jgi:hypothetical protein
MKSDVSARSLATWLKLWRIRDHGSVAAFDNASLLGEKEVALVRKYYREGLAPPYAGVAEAIYPVLEYSDRATPLLPFIVHSLKKDKAVAVIRLRAAPYNTVAFTARQRDGKWRIESIAACVDN